MRALTYVVLILVGLTGTAAADRTVDWSEYIEKPTDKPLKVHAADAPPVAAAQAKPARVAKAKTSKKKAKVKARKAKPQSKATSRHK